MLVYEDEGIIRINKIKGCCPGQFVAISRKEKKKDIEKLLIDFHVKFYDAYVKKSHKFSQVRKK